MNFRFSNLGSGSAGNASFLETKHSRILIDAGFSGREIENLLQAIEIDPSTLDGILITHEHSDHIKGAGVLSRRYKLPILANEATWRAMYDKLGQVQEENILVFQNDLDFNFRDLDVHPMSIYHDSADACAYVFYGGGKKISILTDTGLVDERMKQLITGSDLYVLEANHDQDLLDQGSYPRYLKDRIASSRGHLSNHQAAQVLAEVLLGKEEQVYLAHLSEENNCPDLVLETLGQELAQAGLDPGRGVHLSVCRQQVPSRLVEL